MTYHNYVISFLVKDLFSSLESTPSGQKLGEPFYVFVTRHSGCHRCPYRRFQSLAGTIAYQRSPPSCGVSHRHLLHGHRFSSSGFCGQASPRCPFVPEFFRGQCREYGGSSPLSSLSSPTLSTFSCPARRSREFLLRPPPPSPRAHLSFSRPSPLPPHPTFS